MGLRAAFEATSMSQGFSPRPDDRFSGRRLGHSSWLDHSLSSGGVRRNGGDPRTKDAPEPSAPLRLGWLAFLAVMLVLLYNAGPLIEEAHYAFQRGRLRAESEDATARLEKMSELNVSDTSLTFPLVVQRVQPSVVQIETLQERPRDLEEGPLAAPRRRSGGQGAGVVIDAAGYILTNYHVVRDSTLVRVRLSDGRRIEGAQVAGTDPATDLAVLKVEADGLIPATWGDSDSLQTGEWVLAVGNPFGLERTVTAGIVSAKHRRNIVQSRDIRYEDFLQTDAAVNPGNSGGPLVNKQGEVVGITTAIVGETFQGVGFAIPSDIARDVYLRLRATGKVQRGWLGVGLENLAEEDARRLKVPPEGVRVTQVRPDSPAMRAGTKVDDVIVAWNGYKVGDFMDLSLRIGRTLPDTKVAVLLRRDGQEMSLEVTVGLRQPGQ
jgi:S1-C subfamily serine protease